MASNISRTLYLLLCLIQREKLTKMFEIERKIRAISQKHFSNEQEAKLEKILFDILLLS